MDSDLNSQYHRRENIKYGKNLHTSFIQSRMATQNFGYLIRAEMDRNRNIMISILLTAINENEKYRVSCNHIDL